MFLWENGFNMKCILLLYLVRNKAHADLKAMTESEKTW